MLSDMVRSVAQPPPAKKTAWAQLRFAAALVVVGTVALASQGCGDGDSSPTSADNACPGVTAKSCPDTMPSYASDVAPILEARCQTCHAPENNAGLWSLGDQASVSEWAGTVLRQIRSCSQPPPDSGVTLTLSERQALEAWLVCGAPDN